MKKIGVWFMLMTMIMTMFAPASYAKEESGPELVESAKSAILLERDTGEILYEKNSEESLPPASMTKIMTMILVMEALDEGKLKLNEKVRASEYAASMGGSQIFLEPGEEMTVEELLKGVAVASGNDASVALAERIAGSESAFVKQMNQKVKELGLKHTKFQNTTGLPAKDHYSTAHDMAVMAKELLKHEGITKYTSIYEDYLRKGTDNEFWLVNTNKLVKFYNGVDGLKTGFTREAMYCLTATAKKDDMRVIAVVMGAETPKDRNSDVSAMLDYAFNHYETESLYKRHQAVDQLTNIRAAKTTVDVVTSESVSVLKKKGQKIENVEKNLVYKKDLTLPIQKGDTVGTLTITSNGKPLSKTDIVVNETVEEAGIWTLFKRSMSEMVKQR
ncbi:MULTISPECIES: D-alanyl-D-alanine carboxypeptidase family protein [Pontibacillus]|uniref:serine-type D-Ala-D-Ala carboxypeptidase n=1 Tax=Pontibacillus chungwhensis TaxID=265426 RepID=A0ABY8UT22_9BACI|nr:MULTISPECIES: D-alanyl-D-alanine carboxypeptidase family protein [Pontibacillus]MCD5323067.1 D-alanyl-D-alanine carboxypeptidase [Pontibacillus sp. HN14]WIF96458.1 D-alanyl-D-alanine carboxypeptidase family protein [Pontibacillus chungwhensis]